MWLDDGDGWRDESTEGPCCELKTHYTKPYQIVQNKPYDWVQLINTDTRKVLKFKTVAEAKKHVSDN